MSSGLHHPDNHYWAPIRTPRPSSEAPEATDTAGVSSVGALDGHARPKPLVVLALHDQ
jgi:hypothetical protein